VLRDRMPRRTRRLSEFRASDYGKRGRKISRYRDFMNKGLWRTPSSDGPEHPPLAVGWEGIEPCLLFFLWGYSRTPLHE